MYCSVKIVLKVLFKSSFRFDIMNMQDESLDINQPRRYNYGKKFN